MIEMLANQLSPASFIVIAFCVGLISGSFLNVVILRLPNQLNIHWKTEAEAFLGIESSDKVKSIDTLVWPPSKCSDCGSLIKPWQNIPVISYILLRGRCDQCSSVISFQYPLIEIITALLVAFTAYNFGLTSRGLLAIVLVIALICLAGIDTKAKLLPDQITLPLLWLGLLANTAGMFISLTDAVFGAILGYLSLWTFHWMFKLITGKEGIGYGDFKLMAVIGAWLGWQMLPLILLIATGMGAMVGIYAIVIGGKDRNFQIPFGPFIATAGWIGLIWGDKIIVLYQSLFIVL